MFAYTSLIVPNEKMINCIERVVRFLTRSLADSEMKNVCDKRDCRVH